MGVCPVPACPHLKPCPTHPMVRGRAHRRNSSHLAGATRCAICQGPFTEENPMERGHVIPLEAGGTNDPGNYRAECRRCNRGRASS